MHERGHSVDTIRRDSQIFGQLQKLMVANRGVNTEIFLLYNFKLISLKII
jgi:hypothetical protein